MIGAIVQARMSSRRYPGKVLHRVGGRTILGYLLDRLKSCKGLESLTVATSLEQSDDPVARFCLDNGVDCIRGPLEDVAGRFIKVLDQVPLDGFLRICGDSPWLDPALVEEGLTLFRQGGTDLVTNVFPRSFPPGQSVEVVDSQAFRKAYAAMAVAEEKEHVTKYLYGHPDQFAIRNFTAQRDYRGLSLALDTKADMASFEAVISALTKPQQDYSLDEVAELYWAAAEKGDRE